MGLLTPALMVSLGAIAGTVLPRMLKVVKPDADKKMFALAAIGTGIGLGMIGGKVVGKKNAEMLALGAISAGVTTFLNQVLPANLRISGVGQGIEVVTESDIDAEIRKLAAGGISGADVFDTFAGDDQPVMATF